MDGVGAAIAFSDLAVIDRVFEPETMPTHEHQDGSRESKPELECAKGRGSSNREAL